MFWNADVKKLNHFSGRLLAAFLALAESAQFKLAAERFNVSQSAFSQMISRLEAELGTRLFDRGTRLVALTPEGQLLVPMARALAADLEAMYDTLRDHAERRQGKVSVAALPSLCADWLPKIVADFRHRYPGIKLQLFDAIADANLDLVRRGTVDFAISARVNSPEEFETQLLFNEPFYFICLPTHPFARMKQVTLRSLAGSDYINSIRTGSVWNTIQPYIRDIEFNDTGLEVGHLSTLAGLIANGVGVSIVPGFTLFQFYRLGLAAVPIRDRGLKRSLLMVKRRGQSLSVAAKALLEMIAENPPAHVLSTSSANAIGLKPTAPLRPRRKKSTLVLGA